jgi:hypothetical protein
MLRLIGGFHNRLFMTMTAAVWTEIFVNPPAWRAVVDVGAGLIRLAAPITGYCYLFPNQPWHYIGHVTGRNLADTTVVNEEY